MWLGGRIAQYAGCAAFFLLGAWAQAEDARNFIDNSGFEELAPPLPEKAYENIWKQNYRNLVQHDVIFPHTGEEMPQSVMLNSTGGWGNDECIFAYLQGSPGGEVHSGNRAIKITSPIKESGIIFGKPISGKPIPVVKGEASAAGVIQAGRPYKYSFYAKGQGSVQAIFVMYESVEVLKGLYDYARFQTVEPTRHEISETDQWTECTGTVTMNSEEVGAVLLALVVKGDVSIDDVQLAP